MLQIRDLHYSVGDRHLLTGVDWMIEPGKRIALIGPNGAGKTTMLRILNGELDEYSGAITKPKDYRIGYLPQEEVTVGSGSVLEVVLRAQEEALMIERKLQELHALLEQPHDQHEALLHQIGELEHRYDALDGYHLETNAKAILSGLGFADIDFARPLSEFSGGWRMRVHLARLLLQQPDLLLLDEPTNHLDIPSLEWLESYLLAAKSSVVIVSHDRFFIDRLAEAIYELDRGKLVYYAGNYHFFEREKEQRLDLLRKQWEEQQAERQRQERFINRFRYKSTKAKQVQSRIKQLEKMEVIELPPPAPTLNFQIKVASASYKDVLHISTLWFRYEEEWVLENIDLSLYRGQKIAMVGVNGAGKTTLTRLIARELQPQQGRVALGERVKLGYYAQHQVETLNLDATVYDEVFNAASDSQRPRVRDVLGMFQFRGDDIYKRIGVLSGGEKARVSLTKILLSPVNFLIMDEPTNHLDVRSKDALEHALMHYDGTLILISHDRYFLDKIVSRVVELKDRRMTDYAGNYSDYLRHRDLVGGSSGKLPTLHESAKNAASPSLKWQNSAPSAPKTKEQKRQEAEARQAVSKERNRLERLIKHAEVEIERCETRKAELEFQLSQPETYDNGELVAELQKAYAAVNVSLEGAYRAWEGVQLELENLQRP
jgi:ATP-binding cassette, subfamily F, member 3